MRIRKLLVFFLLFNFCFDSFSLTEDFNPSAGCPSCGVKVQNGQAPLDALNVTFEAIGSLTDCQRKFVDYSNDDHRNECFYLATTSAYEAMKSLPESVLSVGEEAVRLNYSLNPFWYFYEWWTGETYFEKTSEVIKKNLEPIYKSIKELIKGHEKEILYYLGNEDYRKKINSIAYQLISAAIYNSVDDVANATCDEMVNVICPVLGELAPEIILDAIITAMTITTSGATGPGLVAIKTEQAGAKLVVKAKGNVVQLSDKTSDAVKNTTKTKAKKTPKTSTKKMHSNIPYAGSLGNRQIARLFNNLEDALDKLINPSDLDDILKFNFRNDPIPTTNREKLLKVMKLCEENLNKLRTKFNASPGKGNNFLENCQKIMPKSDNNYFMKISPVCISNLTGNLGSKDCKDLVNHLEQYQFGGNTYHNKLKDGIRAFPNINKNKNGTSIKSMYVEMDIDVNVLAGKRGSKRIVYDKETGDAWFTDDHYETSTYAGCLGLKNKTCTDVDTLKEICRGDDFTCSVP